MEGVLFLHRESGKRNAHGRVGHGRSGQGEGRRSGRRWLSGQRRTRTCTLTSIWVGKLKEVERVRLDRVEAKDMECSVVG